MPVEAAIGIAAAILFATTIGLVIFVAVRAQKAKEEEMRRAASSRGWKFEAKTERGYRVHRWTGSTDGVVWTAESLDRRSNQKGTHQRRHIARWHGAWSPGISGAIVAMGLPKGKEELGKSVADGDGFFARLAQKAAGFAFDKAIDVYFGDGPGKEVDAGAMHRVDGKIPGFVIMAADKTEGARIMHDGLEHALLEATGNRDSVLSDEDRPWILLRPNAVSVARMKKFLDVNDVDAFVRAGVALTRAFKFGHRSG
jgi:hypothetical protein